MTQGLAELILELGEALPADGAFVVRPLGDGGSHYVGRDDSGRACVLIAAADAGYRAPVRLAGLDVQYSIECTVQLPERPDVRESLTVVRCTASDGEVERYFLRVMDSILELLGPRPRLQSIAEAVMRLASIFQKLAQAPKDSVTGLIGEIVVIVISSDPASAVAAWRQDPDERYDFAARELRLEVKSSMTRRRVHGFSYEQCDVPQGCVGVLASLFIERSTGGLSLEDLIRRVQDRLAGDAAATLRLELAIADTLGTDLPQALHYAFDFDTASSSLAFFDLSAIPAVRTRPPAGVSRVHFQSDVSGVPQLAPEIVVRSCPPFASFIPVA